MKKTTLLLTAAFLGVASTASAATLVVSSTAPTSGSYFDDAYSNVGIPSGLMINNGGPTGQSFIHTNTAGEIGAGLTSWNLESVTFQGFGSLAENTDAEAATGLVLRIFEGSGTGTQLGSDISVGTGTFDSVGTYLTFDLTSSETAGIGALTSGAQYTAALVYTIAGSSFRIGRSDSDASYANGQAILTGDAITNGDAAFYIGGTAIPEPSSYALLAGLLGLGYVMVRRRN